MAIPGFCNPLSFLEFLLHPLLLSMFTGILIAAIFLTSGAIAFSYLKNG